MDSNFHNPLQDTDQNGNVEGVSRNHAGNGLIMTIAWSGKSKRFHTMWLFKIYTTFIQKCIMPIYVVMSLVSQRK